MHRAPWCMMIAMDVMVKPGFFKFPSFPMRPMVLMTMMVMMSMAKLTMRSLVLTIHARRFRLWPAAPLAELLDQLVPAGRRLPWSVVELHTQLLRWRLIYRPRPVPSLRRTITTNGRAWVGKTAMTVMRGTKCGHSVGMIGRMAMVMSVVLPLVALRSRLARLPALPSGVGFVIRLGGRSPHTTNLLPPVLTPQAFTWSGVKEPVMYPFSLCSLVSSCGFLALWSFPS